MIGGQIECSKYVSDDALVDQTRTSGSSRYSSIMVKRQTLQMKAQNMVFLSGESRDIITQKMRHIYVDVEEHEHGGTIMSQLQGARGTHSSPFDSH